MSKYCSQFANKLSREFALLGNSGGKLSHIVLDVLDRVRVIKCSEGSRVPLYAPLRLPAAFVAVERRKSRWFD